MLVVPRPRTPAATARPAAPRQLPAEPEGAPQPSTPDNHGLDWARRIELISVLVAAFVGVVGLWYSTNQVRQELALSKEGQITDRYTNAVENLGDDAMDVRLGGIYALQRIMQDWPRDHPTIANVLATYVRTHSSKPPKKGQDVPADVFAALTVLAHRDPTRDDSFFPDLRKTHLPGIELRPRQVGDKSAELSRANLSDANLTRAVLVDANLTKANLTGVNLTSANLIGANLAGANLAGVNLTGAELINANLARAYRYLELRTMNLTDANLTDANLSNTDLTDANLSNTDLTNANLSNANLSNANLSGADLPNTNLSGADLSGAQLRSAGYLRAEQVVKAVIDSTTELPAYLAEDPAVKARIAEAEGGH
ncbi:pentapeptide repeat-containing protein [Streptomyces venetus]|uniref:pentapeptide repeat-containing protein n=1 Tax=Streptomyces venetus TaxID=1701086 RepID=UPI0031E8458B